jgi:hypothetical protein
MPDHRKAIQIREVKIEQYAVRFELLKTSQPLISGSGFGVDVASRTARIETEFEDCTINRVVVNQEYPEGVVRWIVSRVAVIH